MTDKPSVLRGLLGPAVLFVILVAAILYAEGVAGFIPLINLEALAIVVLGGFALVWSVYPLREIFPPKTSEVADYAAQCSVAMGLVGTILGMILLLASVDDVANVPRRMALALTCLFFGLFFSEVVFAPIAARMRRREPPDDSAPRVGSGHGRLFRGLFGLTMVLLCFFVLLYALSAALIPV